MTEILKNIEPWFPTLTGIVVLIVAAFIGDVVVRRGLLALVHLFADKTKLAWGEVLISHRVFRRVSHIIPALIVTVGLRFVPDLPEPVRAAVENVVTAYIILMIVMAAASALTAANEIYDRYPVSRNRPLKGLVQVVQLIVYLIGSVLIVATLIDRSPLLLLSGFGAMTAVLLLVFKDTILGFVASIQLTANDMVRVGDWVEMPAYGADGDVIEVALHTVKVQNFDKTITTIPTYKLISESFRNWRGMSESGGRRIRRSILVDQSSIGFLTDEEIDRLRTFALLREHFDTKARDLNAAAASLSDADDAPVNRRRLTNIGVLRAYVVAYLRRSGDVNQSMTLLVRQLPPGPEGLPLEIYCFTATTDWLEYEDMQSDIFDHIIAIVPEFGLRIFQRPSGSDLRRIGEKDVSV